MKYAIDNWLMINARIPSAAGFRSGVHGTESDFAWFASRLNRSQVLALREPPPTSIVEDIKQLPEISFRYDASGRSWLDAGETESAITQLKKAETLRLNDKAYSFLQLALAYKAMNNDAETHEWLERAEETRSTREDKELSALFDEARNASPN
ncbi:MAG: hypothetical protein KDB23_08440 [Planctomycetales bacterium]|nr:hypothetical protein [Planctomycetales bacterium]